MRLDMNEHQIEALRIFALAMNHKIETENAIESILALGMRTLGETEIEFGRIEFDNRLEIRCSAGDKHCAINVFKPHDYSWFGSLHAAMDFAMRPGRHFTK